MKNRLPKMRNKKIKICVVCEGFEETATNELEVGSTNIVYYLESLEVDDSSWIKEISELIESNRSS